MYVWVLSRDGKEIERDGSVSLKEIVHAVVAEECQLSISIIISVTNQCPPSSIFLTSASLFIYTPRYISIYLSYVNVTTSIYTRFNSHYIDFCRFSHSVPPQLGLDVLV